MKTAEDAEMSVSKPNEEIIQVEFEIQAPCESYYHMTRILVQYLLDGK
jgi:hypothetical protein